MFRKDEYIITTVLGANYVDMCAKENYCFKVERADEYLTMYKDLVGDRNGHSTLTFDKTKQLKDWRYATPEEIQHYNLIDKPYDVNTLPKFVLPERWCVKDTANEESNELYEYANIHGVMPPYRAHVESSYFHFPCSDYCTTKSDKDENYTEITLAQFKTYVLGNVIVKEDYSYLIEFLTTKGIK